VPNNDLPGIDLDIDIMRHVAEIMGFAPAEIKRPSSQGVRH
jgi:hypothetical protein